MRPDVVTFWHGPLNALRLTCLRSQVAVGHKVTVYGFAKRRACHPGQAFQRSWHMSVLRRGFEACSQPLSATCEQPAAGGA